jgi:hypothetical protein
VNLFDDIQFYVLNHHHYRAGYSIVFTPIEQQLEAMASYRELAAERGWTVQPDDTIFSVIA